MTKFANPIAAIAALTLVVGAVSGCSAPAPAAYAPMTYGAPVYQPTGTFTGIGGTGEGNEMGEGNGY